MRIRLCLLIMILTSFYAIAGCSDESGGEISPNDTTIAAESTNTVGEEASGVGGETTRSTTTGPEGVGGKDDDSSPPSDVGEAQTDGGSAAPADETGSPSTTASTEVRTYSDAERGFEFAYPADWYLSTDVRAEGTAGGSPGDTVGIFDPRGAQSGGVLLDGILISVYELDARVDEGLMPEFQNEVAEVIPQLDSQLTDLLVVQPLQETTLNGLPGYEVTVTFTNEGTELRNRLLFVVDGSTEYQLTAQAAAADWGRLQPPFDVVLGSFRSTR